VIISSGGEGGVEVNERNRDVIALGALEARLCLGKNAGTACGGRNKESKTRCPRAA